MGKARTPTTAVVAQIERAVRTNCQAVWATPVFENTLVLHPGSPALQRPWRISVSNHRAIVADHGAFRETESSGKNGDVTHAILLLMDGGAEPSRCAWHVRSRYAVPSLFPCMALDCAAYGSMIHGVI